MGIDKQKKFGRILAEREQMKKKVDANTRPNLKDYPQGYVECEGGFWTYSRRAVRAGRAGWMFHKVVKEKK